MIFIRGAKRFSQPPQPPEPFTSFMINVLFQHEILRDVVGPAARHFVCFVCFVVKNPCILWFPYHSIRTVGK